MERKTSTIQQSFGDGGPSAGGIEELLCQGENSWEGQVRVSIWHVVVRILRHGSSAG